MDPKSTLKSSNERVDELNAYINEESESLRQKLLKMSQTARTVLTEVESVVENPLGSVVEAADPGAIVRERPFTAVAVGLSMGWLLGTFLSRSHTPSSNIRASGSSFGNLKEYLARELEDAATDFARGAFRQLRMNLGGNLRGRFAPEQNRRSAVSPDPWDVDDQLRH